MDNRESQTEPLEDRGDIRVCDVLENALVEHTKSGTVRWVDVVVGSLAFCQLTMRSAIEDGSAREINGLVAAVDAMRDDLLQFISETGKFS